MNTKIPVTILSGFLGAGKTTTLNSIIAQNPDKKIIVIENEFGEIGIDNALVVGLDSKVFELNNGCICCNLNEDLLNVLSELINNDTPIDHLIIETTGMADPGPVALNFITDENIQQYFEMNAIITLVDTQHIEQQLEAQEEAVKQIAIADIVLLNKCDITEPYQIDVAQNIIKRINSEAKIYQSTLGKTSSVDLLNIKAFNAQTLLDSDLYQKKKNFSTGNLTIANQSFQIGSLLTKPNRHQVVNSHSFIIKEPIDFLRFEMWVNMMLQLNPDSIYRMKGILYFEDFDQKVIFQSVMTQYVCSAGGEWNDNETKESVLVIIGKNLVREQIENALLQITIK